MVMGKKPNFEQENLSLTQFALVTLLLRDYGSSEQTSLVAMP